MDDFIDVRIYLKREVEDFGDGDTYSSFEREDVRISDSSLSEDELDSLAEHWGQSDSFYLEVPDGILRAMGE